MPEPYVVSIGEALIDLMATECDGQRVYRPEPGGSPMNVAAGVARLGVRAEFVGSFGADPLAERLRAFLDASGVGLRGSITVPVPTSIALTDFDGAEPHYTFYGHPHSYGQLSPERLDRDLVAGAAVVHAGSNALLEAPVLAAVRAAFAVDGPYRTLDPNVRPALVDDFDDYRSMLEQLMGTADLVKLSVVDGRALYGAGAEAATVAGHLRGLGAGTVVVTLGADGALLSHGDDTIHLPGRQVEAIDATGAGDSFTAGLITGIVAAGGRPRADQWRRIAERAVDVAALTCTTPGAADAVPTPEALRDAFGW